MEYFMNLAYTQSYFFSFFNYVYFTVTVILLFLLTEKNLNTRGYFLDLKSTYALFLIICVFVGYNLFLPVDFTSISKLVFILPTIITITIVDSRQRVVYDEDIIIGILIEVGILLFQISIYRNYNIDYLPVVKDIIKGMLLLFVISFFIVVATKSMGMGDVLYFLLAGIVVGCRGAIEVFFVSFISAGFYCIFYYLTDKTFKYKNYDGLISFTPFISVAIILTVYIL